MRSDERDTWASLKRARYEIIPMKGVDEQLGHLPPDAVVTVTASPAHGMGETLKLSAKVAALGNPVVPHLSARLVAGPGHLEEILGELALFGIEEAFVIAGDATTPAGPYEGAADLLEAMADRTDRPRRIGITGYPESHSFIPDQQTIDAMARKAPHADYIVSQICYDPTVIRGWIGEVRSRGIELPIVLGIPGVIDRARLLRVSLRVGLGDSVRYLRSQPTVAAKLLSGYQPDELIAALADLVDDPIGRVAGWHVCTFNEVERTERWRRGLLGSVASA
jgi:methylenetetrahydrofolate reductase (NADPH)